MERVVDPLAKKPSILRSHSEAIGFVIMVVALVVAPFVTYPLFLMQAMCFALFACAFNLLIGYVGLLSFGHALYFGWASYLSAYSAKAWGFPPELAILTGTATAAICDAATRCKILNEAAECLPQGGLSGGEALGLLGRALSLQKTE